MFSQRGEGQEIIPSKLAPHPSLSGVWGEGRYYYDRSPPRASLDSVGPRGLPIQSLHRPGLGPH